MNVGAPENRLLGYLSLFTSLGTLICCALPSLLVFLGLGATVASFVSAAPWVVALSRHKFWVFVLAGTLIGANFAYVYYLAPRLRQQGEGCSFAGASACDTAGRVSRAILWVSAGIYFGGFFVAYILTPILRSLDS